ncbi:Sfi1-domain-containing protein [Choiromyces venosus 120613-1]|uniref:Sfi1-domain-containing protein n=1 Tax=Choiromyces venosus 120613-1 TaxID=1336337 RepID=A0A3N4J3G7_9PEZI|nr:Sfi1-domain-containing protein [Choiromyces venosus 120613-1]
MPPPPPHDITSNAVASRQGYRYTAADLQILHEIVSLASVIPENGSFRTIWRAYDTVLAARQINPALDSVYFRFILQLQAAGGNTLYDKFMQLLDDQGVDISETRFLETPAPTSDYTRRRYEEAKQRRDRATRGYAASEEEEEEGGYAAGDEYDRQHVLLPLRRTSIEVRPSRRASGSQVGSRSPREDAIRAAELAAETRREEVRRRREQLEAEESRPEASRIPDPPRVPENAADALYNLRMRTVLREYFHHWHQVTIQRVVRRRSLEQIAFLRDRKTLLRQAFDIWQETRWFAVVERRAEARYNSRLLAGAFRLWIQKTAAIVQRSQEVRERILARKYFGAWRQVVVENNTKIRLFRLSGALLKWKNSLARKRDMAAQAQEVFERNLAHRAYWTWFFKLCGVLGTRRSNEKLLLDKLSVWVDRTEEKIRMNRMAEAFFRRRTLQVIFEHWSFRTIKCLDQADIAVDHREWSLARGAFETWRRETRFTPLLDVMVEFVNDRIGDTFFTAWRTRARQSVEAEKMSRTRLLGPIFRNWRLRVRYNVMVERVDERVAICTLHEWVLQSRLLEFGVHSERELKADALSHWVERFRNQEDKMESLCHEMTVRRNRRIAVDALHMLRRKLRVIQLSGNEARAVYRSNLVSRALVKWRAGSDIYVQLDDWADDAVYYFTVRRTLRRWMKAFRESRKRRLRTAYRTTSRKTKRNLAAKVMEVWKNRFNRIQEMNDTAQDFSHEQMASTALDIFQRWKSQMENVLSLTAQAEEANDLRIMRQHLTIWTDRHNQNMELEEQARLFSEEATVRAAIKYFSLWETKSWHLNMLRMTASRFERKRFKALFRVWRIRTQDGIDSRLEEQERTRILIPPGLDDTIEGGFGEDWIAPLQPGAGQSSTPLGTPNPQRSSSVVMSTPWRTSVTTALARSRLFGRTPGATPGGGRLFGRTVDGAPPASPLLRSTVRRSREFGRSRLGGG